MFVMFTNPNNQTKMSKSIEELWDRSHDLFLSSLERFSAQPNPPASVLKKSILPIHGAKLGNILQPTASSKSSEKDAEFKLRARREKALYDIQVALAGLQEAFDKSAGEENDNMKQALAVYQKIASNISLDTAPEYLQLYHSILSVKPYEF